MVSHSVERHVLRARVVGAASGLQRLMLIIVIMMIIVTMINMMMIRIITIIIIVIVKLVTGNDNSHNDKHNNTITLPSPQPRFWNPRRATLKTRRVLTDAASF